MARTLLVGLALVLLAGAASAQGEDDPFASVADPFASDGDDPFADIEEALAAAPANETVADAVEEESSSSAASGTAATNEAASPQQPRETPGLGLAGVALAAALAVAYRSRRLR